jgi:hypothetical protein
MPSFYVPPEVSKRLMEISGGDFNHPVVSRFIQDMVNAKIRAETLAAVKRFFISAFIAGFMFLLISGVLFLLNRIG